MHEKKTTDNVENGIQNNLNHNPAAAQEVSGGLGTGGNVVNLPAAVLDKLYHAYSIKQRRGGLRWFLIASILFNIWTLIVSHGQGLGVLVVTLVVLSANISFGILLHLKSQNHLFLEALLRHLHEFAPHVLWTCCIIHLVLYTLFQPSTSPRDIVGWAILLNFLIYVTLPIPLFFTGCFVGIMTFSVYFIVILAKASRDAMFFEQILANAVLILTAVVVGLLYYFMGEAKQKRAFLEAKKSLEVKMIIEEQSAEQERLLLSVLPKHVAVKMRQDLGSTSSEPFKKIYMSRHENVSILYADIVGFTAISSTYSAQDLVKMLNELFARFDRLAEKYQQLRIKILGDCYYCISGAPVERSDHAVLCVHMGLSMVKAIKYVQQKANSPVDMRVGIHTGAILAGILGQRQWQFDVYSKDVELANKMESSGKAGRVHISDKTLNFLSGEFEVEPAFGERREEALRIAGLKTYFITRVIKPFVSPGPSLRRNESDSSSNDQDTPDDELLAQKADQLQEEEEEVKSETNEKQEIFKVRLQEELVARNGHENLSKDTSLFLKFTNENLETSYAAYREPFSSLPLVASLLIQCVDIIYSYIVLPRSPLHFVNISAPLIPLMMLVFVSVAESFPQSLPRLFVNVSKRFNDIIFVRELAAIIIAITLGLSNLVDMYFFVSFLNPDHIVTEREFNLTTDDILLTHPPFLQSDVVIYPSYMSNFGVLILISISVIAQLTHVTKIVLMTTIAALHCCFNIFILPDLYILEQNPTTNQTIPTYYCTSGILIVASLALSLFARYMDREDRVIFKWKTEVAEQKEMATDMRQRNEALVYNVLPIHVAEHFMKNAKRSHDDLYSQSYAEVGVLFASMPNFSDFYSEETVNNQGLECLRFLNEVISDFDALLELPKFQDIIKIKTIGSTYMAASGINIHRSSHLDDPVIKKWAHLAVLVEFALELKNALQGINEQSFNHFVLKMGINHGPITAGVIGARKPHYDIWGNTVNVASRMESTGKAGSIQVTEETCNILQEFGYTFQQRGLVSVKGKGELMTYYLQGKLETKESAVSTKLNSSTENLNISSEQTGNYNEIGNGKCSKQDETESDIKTPLLNTNAKENTVESRVGSNNENQVLLK